MAVDSCVSFKKIVFFFDLHNSHCAYVESTVSRFLLQPAVDDQWARAMQYVNDVSELNYMTQIVIMVYEDPNKV